MVVLTLHRDVPLSPDEIQALPIGCYPVMSHSSDVVARAELNLPMAHVARFAAAVARAIPDADFSAEHRPTAEGVAVLSAAALDDPFWAYEPALSFRRPMPGAHTLATQPGTPLRRSSPLVSAPSLDSDLLDEAEEGEETDPSPSSLQGEMDLGELVRRLEAREQAPAPEVAPEVAPPPPMLSGVELSSEVPPELLAMLRQMQQLNPLSDGGEDTDASRWPTPPPREDIRPPTGPAADEAWSLLAAGEEAAAEGAFLLRGVQPDDIDRLAEMFLDAAGERVAQACRVARWLDWPGGVGFLQRAAHHADPEARLAAVQALALHGGTAVEPLLHMLVRDPEPRVSALAQRALKRVLSRSRL